MFITFLFIAAGVGTCGCGQSRGCAFSFILENFLKETYHEKVTAYNNAVRGSSPKAGASSIDESMAYSTSDIIIIDYSLNGKNLNISIALKYFFDILFSILNICHVSTFLLIVSLKIPTEIIMSLLSVRS